MFELSPFLDLLEWTAATDLFNRTGNAEALAGLLKNANAASYRAGSQASDLPKELSSAATALDLLSQAMRLVRVHEVMQKADIAVQRLAVAETEASRWAKPFGVLLEQLRRGYAPFALADPQSDAAQDLRVQLELIRWYSAKGWGLEAIALAREWIVSLATCRLGRHMFDEREDAERLLHEAASNLRSESQQPAADETAPVNRAMARAWNDLHDLRNDLAHAGMRRSPRPVNRLRASIAQVHTKLEALANLIPAGNPASGES